MERSIYCKTNSRLFCLVCFGFEYNSELFTQRKKTREKRVCLGYGVHRIKISCAMRENFINIRKTTCYVPFFCSCALAGGRESGREAGEQPVPGSMAAEFAYSYIVSWCSKIWMNCAHFFQDLFCTGWHRAFFRLSAYRPIRPLHI